MPDAQNIEPAGNVAVPDAAVDVVARTVAEAPPPVWPAERTIGVAVLLSLSGGFLDAFTYVGHGQVFANAMTGNVVFLGLFAASGEWRRALRHVPPILAFLAGIFAAHVMRVQAIGRPSRRPALICLGVEILLLLGVALLPRSFPDVWLVLGIAFVAALQNSSFTRVETFAYNSVMTTGNLRRCAEGLFAGTLPAPDPLALRQARVFGVICLSFLAGACAGGFATMRWHNAAALVPALVLTAAFVRCRRRD
jgi:uncharacterized membrane protein YoaK (UPF0700 family)